MKKNILTENMHRFGTKNLNEADSDANNNGYPDETETTKYQTLAQRGKLSGLDPEMDTAYMNSVINRIIKNYDRVRYRRIDMTNFNQDLMDLFEKYKTPSKPGTAEHTESHANFQQEFKSMYPISTTYSGWKGVASEISSDLTALWKLAKSIAKGDTSNIGYRVHQWRQDNNIK